MQVGDATIATAWEQFSDLILQHFVYDAFWASLSPDARFPWLTRRLLNNAFARLVSRARRLSAHAVAVAAVAALAVRAPVFLSPFRVMCALFMPPCRHEH
jgi:hypothetical protein